MTDAHYVVGCDAEDCVHNNEFGVCLHSRFPELSQFADYCSPTCVKYRKRAQKPTDPPSAKEKEVPVEAEEELYCDNTRPYEITWRRGKGEKRTEVIKAVSADQALRISTGEFEVKNSSPNLNRDAPWKHGEGWSVAEIREQKETSEDFFRRHLAAIRAAIGEPLIEEPTDKPPTKDTYGVLLQCQNCGMLALAAIPTGYAVHVRGRTASCPHCRNMGTLTVCLNWWTAPIGKRVFPDPLPEFDWTK